jgi:hypothetical protein
MKVSLPAQVKTVRHVPPREVEVPGPEIPLIDPKDPPHKQVQEIWSANVDVFDLSDRDQLARYREVWQEVCDQKALVSEHRTEWVASKGAFVALLRWARLSYVAPKP